MRNMTIKPIFLVAICLSLSACLVEPTPQNLDEQIKKLSAEDVDRFNEAIESLGRGENAIRVLTQYSPPATVPAKTQELADLLGTDICKVLVTENPNKWGPSDVAMQSTGSECPLLAQIERSMQTDGILETSKIQYERKFREDQIVTEAREVRIFTATGTRLRRQIKNVPVPTEQRRESISGKGVLQNGDAIEINITDERRQVFGKETYENRKRRLVLTIKQKVYSLEGIEETNQFPVFKLNGEAIQPYIFEDYFSKLGFIGSLSSLTDAG
jgi:hypothetical protein